MTTFTRRFGVVIVLALAGCGGQPASPVRMDVIAASGCERELGQVLGDFEARGIYIPGWTLRIWLPERSAETPYVDACVPLIWSGTDATSGAEALKGQLRAAVGRLCAGNPPPVSFTKDCPPLDDGATSELRVLATADGALRGLAGQPPTAASHAAVICDVSKNEAEGLACTPERIAGLWEAWLISDLPGEKSTFTVYKVSTDVRTSALLAEIELPSLLSPAQAVAFALNKRRVLLNLPLPMESNSSAILETLDWAVPRTLQRPGRHRFLLLSDLMQYTKGGQNFEVKIPEAAWFVDYLKKQKHFNDFHGAPVTGCAAFLKPDPQRAEVAHVVWQNAFGAMNAGPVAITEQCPTHL